MAWSEVPIDSQYLAEVDFVRSAALLQGVVDSGDGLNARRCAAQDFADGSVFLLAGIQIHHRSDDLQAVLYAMIGFTHEKGRV